VVYEASLDRFETELGVCHVLMELKHKGIDQMYYGILHAKVVSTERTHSGLCRWTVVFHQLTLECCKFVSNPPESIQVVTHVPSGVFHSEAASGLRGDALLGSKFNVNRILVICSLDNYHRAKIAVTAG
jgi:hypothetical protein